MAETPEEKYNRIAAAVRETILRDFPNPNRDGCPGVAKLREVAARRTVVEDNDWQHITHCSPCYGEFLAEKERVRRSRRRVQTLTVLATAAVLILFIGVAAYVVRRNAPEQIARIAPEPATLDLKESSGVRGDAKTLEKAIPVLPRGRLQLTVVLPFGSEAGKYQFRLVDAEGRVLKTGDAFSAVNAGATRMTTQLDTSGLSQGDYRFALRQEALDWIIYPVRLR
jgi:hypothetical protein